MITSILTAGARQAFSRAMRFEEGGGVPRLPAAGDARPRLLYLHIPFCERLCPYCSFHRVPFAEATVRAYHRALRREIALYRDRGYDFGGIYVGGGTPTVLVDELAETLAAARDAFSIRELSVETNPDHLTEARLALLERAGVNRLSVGVQSFDDGLLRRMERYDKYGSGEAIAERLRAARGRFATLNADMIFNFPTQTEAMVERDLALLTGMGIDQVTWYPLMVSDATRQKVAATLGRVDFSRERALYRRIAGTLVPPYRFSSAWCFSRGAAMIDEYIVDYGQYAGLGSGAIGYLDGTCYANTFDIAAYIDRLGRGELPLAAARHFSLRDRVRYDWVMALFATRLDVAAFRRRYGGRFWSLLWPEMIAFTLLGGLGRRGDELALTARGRYFWVVLMREFFTAVNNFRDHCRAQVAS